MSLRSTLFWTMASIVLVATPGRAQDQWSDAFGVPGIGYRIIGCAVDYRGDPVVGGRFVAASGELVNNVTRWNGAVWERLGDGVEQTVLDAKVFRNELYVASRMDVTSSWASSVHHFDGASWSVLGSFPGNSPALVLSGYNSPVHGEILVAASRELVQQP